ncbi:formyl transferase [Devosia soli]
MIVLRSILARVFDARVREIVRDNDLDTSPIPEHALHRVSSVNSTECIDLVGRLGPRVIVVNGTRIISKRLLDSTNAKFINTHAGITPEYRGVHGGYWALYEGKQDRCGVTVHLVDSGIDTGEIISQAIIVPTKTDGFPTYPYLQISSALGLLRDAIDACMDERLETHPSKGRSAVWYHPGIFQYVAGLLRGIR